MPIRIPVVKGMRSSPASRIVSSRTAGRLSGEPKCGPPRSESRSDARLEHDPLRRRHLAQRRELVARHHARVRVRQQPGLVEHEAAHPHEVLDRRLAAELGELLARGAVAALRLVAEREQRLAAAGRGAGARDVEHLVRGHVRTLAPARRRGERAVVADVAAELRQRDEDLRRVGDEPPLTFVAEACAARAAHAGA